MPGIALAGELILGIFVALAEFEREEGRRATQNAPPSFD
jgi:DNA invertase Pin-like site-specific DNA recombinase